MNTNFSPARLSRLLAWAILLMLVGPFLAAWNRLPEPVATHWGSSGAPDGSMSKVGIVLLVSIIWLVIAGREMLPFDREDSGNVQASEHPSSARVPPFTVMLAAGVVLVVASGITVWANLGNEGWESAKHVRPLLFTPVVIVAMASGALVGSLLQRRGAALPGTLTPAPTVGLGPHEKAVWFGNAHNLPMFAGLVILAVFMWVGADVGPAGLVMAAVAFLIAVFFCWIQVVVQEMRIEVGFGPWHWPKKVVSVDHVAQASTEHVQPLRYGGWGYRLCGLRCRAIVVRRGDALKLKMNDEKVLIVTVDHAEEAAGLINDLRTRSLR